MNMADTVHSYYIKIGEQMMSDSALFIEKNLSNKNRVIGMSTRMCI